MVKPDAEMKSNRQAMKWLGLTAIGFVIFIAVLGVIHPKIEMTFKAGGSAEIEPSSLLASVRGANCRITLRTKLGKSATIGLLQTLIDAPLILIPSSNEDVFFCVYDYDVDFELLRIDLTQPFRPVGVGDPLRAIVLASTCRVERVLKAETNDWAFASAALKEMPAAQYTHDQITGLKFGFFRIGTSQKLLFESIHTCGGQGVYNGESTTPWYIREQRKGGRK